MPVFLPNSNGEDNSPAHRYRGAPLREFNKCHNPAGPGGGRFCSAPDAGSGGGPSAALTEKPKPTQRYGRPVPTAPSAARVLKAIQDDPAIPAKQKQARQFEALRKAQPELVAEVRSLLQRGAAGHTEFREALQEIAGRLRFKTHHDIEAEAVTRGNDGYVIVGKVKGLERAAVKVASDYDGDVRQLKDVLRGTIAVRDGAEFMTTLRELSRVATIEHVTDTVTQPLSTGYRDLKILVRMKGSGLIAEIQLVSKPMLRAKAGRGHKLYSAWRSLVEGSPEANVLERRQRRLYNTAWAMTAATTILAAGLPALLQSLRMG